MREEEIAYSGKFGPWRKADAVYSRIIFTGMHGDLQRSERGSSSQPVLGYRWLLDRHVHCQWEDHPLGFLMKLYKERKLRSQPCELVLLVRTAFLDSILNGIMEFSPRVIDKYVLLMQV